MPIRLRKESSRRSGWALAPVCALVMATAHCPGVLAAKSAAANATGTLLTVPFKPTVVNYNSGIIVFRSNVRSSGPSGMRLAIGFNGDEMLPGKTMTVSGGFVKGAQHKIWTVTRTINGANHRSLTKSGYDNYELRIRFYQPKGNILPGYIDLNMREEKTVLKGYFFAQRSAENQVFL